MDYNVLRSSMPYYTYFEVLNGGCSGVYLPLGCSGKYTDDVTKVESNH